MHAKQYRTTTLHKLKYDNDRNYIRRRRPGNPRFGHDRLRTKRFLVLGHFFCKCLGYTTPPSTHPLTLLYSIYCNNNWETSELFLAAVSVWGKQGGDNDIHQRTE